MLMQMLCWSSDTDVVVPAVVDLLKSFPSRPVYPGGGYHQDTKSMNKKKVSQPSMPMMGLSPTLLCLITSRKDQQLHAQFEFTFHGEKLFQLFLQQIPRKTSKIFYILDRIIHRVCQPINYLMLVQLKPFIEPIGQVQFQSYCDWCKNQKILRAVFKKFLVHLTN